MKSSVDLIRDHARQGAELRLAYLAEREQDIDALALAFARCLAAGGKILACGNGGSAADAQHFTGELVGRFLIERPALPAIALTVDSSIMTAVGNDYGFDEVFARQVRGLGKKDDMLLAISTSGNSPNVLAALQAAREMGMATAGLSGNGAGAMPEYCDHLLAVPAPSTPLIQEVHGALVHLLCRLIDYYLFENALALSQDER